jgi:hypothetical protein
VLLLAALGGLGGIVAVLGMVYVIGRGIFKQVTAIENMTTAINNLSAEVTKLKDVLTNHETRITVLEDRQKR